MVLSTWRVHLSSSVKSFWKLSHRHTQKHVSIVILNPVKLTMKTNHCSLCCFPRFIHHVGCLPMFRASAMCISDRTTSDKAFVSLVSQSEGESSLALLCPHSERLPVWLNHAGSQPSWIGQSSDWHSEGFWGWRGGLCPALRVALTVPSWISGDTASPWLGFVSWRGVSLIYFVLPSNTWSWIVKETFC